MAYAKTSAKYPPQMLDAVLQIGADEMAVVTIKCPTEQLAKSLCSRFYALFSAVSKEMREARMTGKGPVPADLQELHGSCDLVIPRVEGASVVLKNKFKDFANTFEVVLSRAEGETPATLTMQQAPPVVARPQIPVSEKAQGYGAKSVGMTKEQADALVAKAKGLLKE